MSPLGRALPGRLFTPGRGDPTGREMSAAGREGDRWLSLCRRGTAVIFRPSSPAQGYGYSRACRDSVSLGGGGTEDRCRFTVRDNFLSSGSNGDEIIRRIFSVVPVRSRCRSSETLLPSTPRLGVFLFLPSPGPQAGRQAWVRPGSGLGQAWGRVWVRPGSGLGLAWCQQAGQLLAAGVRH